MSESETDLIPISSALARGWAFIAVCALTGSLAGFAFSVLSPAKYIAEATLGVTINYGVTQPLELVVEDRALNRVSALLGSDETLNEILERLSDEVKQSRELSEVSDLREIMRLEQRLAEWGLTAMDRDSAVAADIAQLWAVVSIEALDEAVNHSWRAIGLIQGPFDVQCDTLRGSNTGGSWDCNVVPMGISKEALAGALRTELELSRGILPNLSYELLRSATPPVRPVVRERGTLVLAGAVLGLLAGSVFVVIRTRQDSTES